MTSEDQYRGFVQETMQMTYGGCRLGGRHGDVSQDGSDGRGDTHFCSDARYSGGANGSARGGGGGGGKDVRLFSNMALYIA